MSIKISTAFYDSIFDDNNQVKNMTEIEEQTLENVRELLNSPAQLSEHIPPLPNILIKLLETLKDPDATFAEFALVIEQDPSLALQVLRVANSAKYARNHEQIDSIRKAVNVLGVSGVANIATTIMMEKIMPVKPIYYKLFGKQIWRHSLHCALMSKMLVGNACNQVFDAYFLGLIHDVGKIIIFECLCNAFSTAKTDSEPGSFAFKALMSEMSMDISYFVANEWRLPEIYCEALSQQRKNRSSELAHVLYKANLISEVYLLFTQGRIKEESNLELLNKLNVEQETWHQFVEHAPEVEIN